MYDNLFMQSIEYGHLDGLQSFSIENSAVINGFVHVSLHTCANIYLCHLHSSATAGMKDIHISTFLTLCQFMGFAKGMVDGQEGT